MAKAASGPTPNTAADASSEPAGPKEKGGTSRYRPFLFQTENRLKLARLLSSRSFFGFCSNFVASSFDFSSSFVSGCFDGFASSFHVCFGVSSSCVYGFFSSFFGSFRASSERESSGRSSSNKSDLTHNVKSLNSEF